MSRQTNINLYERARKRAGREVAKGPDNARREVRHDIVAKPRSRKEIVDEREAQRLEKRLRLDVSTPGEKPRFKKDEQVDDATAERTAMRLKRLEGVRPHGINVSDGVTGREARLARNAVAAERDSRKTIHVNDPVQPGRTRSQDELEDQASDRRREARRPPQLHGKELKKLATDRLRGLRDAGDELRIPPRPGDKPYRIAAASATPRQRRRRRAAAIRRSWTQPERYDPRRPRAGQHP